MKKHKFSERLPDVGKEIFAKCFGHYGVFRTEKPRLDEYLVKIGKIKETSLLLLADSYFVDSEENDHRGDLYEINLTMPVSEDFDWWADPEEED